MKRRRKMKKKQKMATTWLEESLRTKRLLLSKGLLRSVGLNSCLYVGFFVGL